MNSLLPNPRYERKFLGENVSLAQAVVLVRRHPALFREVYPPRIVNNIYLDSPGLGDYLAHINGLADRAKTRIRWYGAVPSEGPARPGRIGAGPLAGPLDKPALERKLKRGLVSGKLTFPLPPLAFERGVSFSQLESVLAEETVAEPLRSALRQVRPALVNRYRRRYFLSADGRFRLTIDWDLEFWPARGCPTDTAAIRPREPGVVIELKFRPEHAEQAVAVSNGLPLRMVRCSKYVLGINAVR